MSPRSQYPLDAAHGNQGSTPPAPSTITNWAVLSRFSSAPLVASGATCDPQAAKSHVERILLENDAAGLGQLAREVIPFTRPITADWRQWPPVGQLQMCRRTRDGGCSWRPMHERPEMRPEEDEAEQGSK
jgi:hypothetical protein